MKQLPAPARLMASTVLALSVTAGVTAAATSTASADVGRSACTESVKFNSYAYTTVKFRTGPSVHYTAKGQLARNTRVYWACNKGSTGSTKSWGFVKVTSGAHKGEWGWVASRYLPVPMQTD